jgi:hypothetical protein
MRAYAHLDVRAVYEKFLLYCDETGKVPTREYFRNYLSRERPPAATSDTSDTSRGAPDSGGKPRGAARTGEMGGSRGGLFAGSGWTTRLFAYLHDAYEREVDQVRRGEISVLKAEVYEREPEYLKERMRSLGLMPDGEDLDRLARQQ